jgi:ABC-type polysaccharide/polyol phosphate transport system ATPase subunit
MKKKKRADNTSKSRVSDFAYHLSDISKQYSLHHEKPTFSENILRPLLQALEKKDFAEEQFWALKNINLSIKQGERVGIIGENGSGKTTLLKILAGITTPTTGKVEKRGRVVSLIDISAGFHPDLTGEENVFLNGMILGMTRDEIKAKFKKIIRFADIGKFIDTPLYTYSEGMKLRLGFSVAVHADPDIILLDEGSAAGDAEFMMKINQQYQKMAKQGKTMISVSHWFDFLIKTVDVSRVIWVEKGKVIMDGGREVLDKYAQSRGS